MKLKIIELINLKASILTLDLKKVEKFCFMTKLEAF